MRDITEAVGRIEGDQYQTSDTTNKAGGKAWDSSTDTKLEQLAMTGTFGRSFYADTRELVESAIETFKKAPALELSNAIIKGRNAGFIRSANILGLVYLSQKDSKLFKKTFPQVIKTGNDLKDFIDVCHKIRGFGRSIKTAMDKWIRENLNDYYALKYRSQIADAIRICRFRGDEAICKFVLHHYNKNLDIKPALEQYPKLNAFELAKVAIAQKDVQTAKNLITEFRLDVGSLLGVGPIDDEIWKALAEVMPVMMFLKYLNKLDRAGAIDMDMVRAKLTVENLKRSKVFPFRLYVAFQHITNQEVANHLADVLDGYVQQFYWGKFNMLEWVVAPDVSMSMQIPVDAERQPGGRAAGYGRQAKGKRTNKPATIAGLFTGFFYKGLERCQVVPWGDRVGTHRVPKRDSVISHIKEVEGANGGGTRMEVPLKHMLDNDINADCILFITDSMEWGEGWLNYWKQYKRKNPKAKAFLLRVDPYPTQSFSDSQAELLDIYQVFGWSDNVVKYIECQL